jgi:ribulose 1,5-bisphosphate synthetase/thiazole synthase
MKWIEEPAKETPVMQETDVLVVGSGPGGLSAAIAAAREGVKVTLVERAGCFGGNITQVGVESIAWYRQKDAVDAGGIGLEFEIRAKSMGASEKEVQSSSQALDPDMFKYVADTMVREAGIVPFLHCYAVDAVMERETIKGIITESKSGRQAIAALRVIDATGDADLAFRAGAPCTKEVKQRLLGATTVFGCSGVDTARFKRYVHDHHPTIGDWDELEETNGKEDHLFSPYIEEPFNLAREAGEIPEDVWIKGTWGRITDAGEVTYLNVVVIPDIDPTDVWDLTRAEMEGRRQALMALEALKKYTPGFERAKLRTFGSSVGVRESRKIRGEYTLTGEEVRNEARFSDSVGIFPEFLDAYGVVIIPTTGRYFQVPYRVLVPRGVENLLVAGRCVSGDRVAFAATRQMMCCCVSGQGAGVAAAESVKEGVSCREVDVSRVQEALKKQGVRV